MISVYDEGWLAYQQGEDIYANPYADHCGGYDVEDYRSSDWHSGFCDACEYEQNKAGKEFLVANHSQ